MNKNSKIFVAGGTGLVGSAIIKNLLDKGYTNIVSTKRSALSAKSEDKKDLTLNSTHLTPKTNSIRYVNLDLLDTKATEEFFDKEQPEFIFLAAAKVGGIVANNTYRADFIYENLAIQNNVIHNAYKYKVKKLLFLGSTCIYPKNAPQPMREDCLLTSPLEYTNEPYAIAKIAGIKMCESYNLQYGTNFISVMPTNLYGQNDNFDLKKSHVLPALIRKIYLGKCLEENDWDAIKKDLNKNPIEEIDSNNAEELIIEKLHKYGITFSINSNSVRIEIWGSGKPRREFLYSEDMADACVYLMEKINFKDIMEPRTCLGERLEELPDSQDKEIRNTHINIGTSIDISIKELATLIQKIIEFKGELYFNTDKPDGTMVKLTDPSKLHSLGWKHKTELQEGIKKVYEWYKNI